MLLKYSKFSLAFLIGTLFSWFQKKGFLILAKRENYNNAEILTETYSTSFHHILISDTYRINAYNRAIQKIAAGKNVLNIGIGPFAVMSELAIAAIAKSVTGVEASPETYKAALNKLNPKFYSKLILINCYSTNLKVPEDNAKYDLLIHEIIGSVGSDEGSLAVIQDAKKRLLVENATIIPRSFSTQIIPVSPLRKITLIESILSNIFIGHKNFFNTEIKGKGIYDVFNFPIDKCISNPCIFESVDFHSNFDLIQKNQFTFSIKDKNQNKDILFDGFVLYLELFVDEDNIINSLAQRTSWNVVYIKLLDTPLLLQEGDEIVVNCEIDARTTNTNYVLDATLPDGNSYTYSWNGSSPKSIGKI